MKLIQELLMLESSSTALQYKLDALERELKTLIRTRAGSAGAQSGIAPQYVPQVNRLKAQIQVAKKELDLELSKSSRVATISQYAASHPLVKHDSQAKVGIARWHELAVQFDGEHGIDKHILELALSQGIRSGVPLSVPKLARDMGVDASTLYKRLYKHDSLRQLRQYMPNPGVHKH